MKTVEPATRSFLKWFEDVYMLIDAGNIARARQLMEQHEDFSEIDANLKNFAKTILNGRFFIARGVLRSSSLNVQLCPTKN